MPSTRILVGTSLLLALSSCGEKEFYPVLVRIGFLPSVTITPSSRIMHRGDTLWLEANFSDSLLDKNSGHRYRVRHQDIALSSAIFYKELPGIGKDPVGIAPTFRLIEKVGYASIDGSFTGSFKPVYDVHYYRAKIGLIPTKACITAISMRMTPGGGLKDLDQLLPFIQLPPDAQGREQKAQLDDSFYIINDGQANNFDLFRQNTQALSLLPNLNSGQILYEQKGTFTVEVK